MLVFGTRFVGCAARKLGAVNEFRRLDVGRAWLYRETRQAGARACIAATRKFRDFWLAGSLSLEGSSRSLTGVLLKPCVRPD